MAFLDSSLVMYSTGSPASTGTLNNSTFNGSTASYYDTTGAGYNTAPTNVFGNGLPGFDIGAVDGGTATPVCLIQITTTGTGTGLLTFKVDAAPQTNATTYTAGTFQTVGASGLYVGTSLVAAKSQIIIPIGPFQGTAGLVSPSGTQAGVFPPRYYRVSVTETSGANAAVSFAAQIAINYPTNMLAPGMPNNFTVV